VDPPRPRSGSRPGVVRPVMAWPPPASKVLVNRGSWSRVTSNASSEVPSPISPTHSSSRTSTRRRDAWRSPGLRGEPLLIYATTTPTAPPAPPALPLPEADLPRFSPSDPPERPAARTATACRRTCRLRGPGRVSPRVTVDCGISDVAPSGRPSGRGRGDRDGPSPHRGMPSRRRSPS